MKVGDLVTLKDYPGAPLAIVTSTASVPRLGKMLIYFAGESRPEWAVPEHWKVVSRNDEDRRSRN